MLFASVQHSTFLMEIRLGILKYRYIISVLFASVQPSTFLMETRLGILKCGA